MKAARKAQRRAGGMQKAERWCRMGSGHLPRLGRRDAARGPGSCGGGAGPPIKDKAEAAYARSDLLEKRRPLMEAWAEHCVGDDQMANAHLPGRASGLPSKLDRTTPCRSLGVLESAPPAGG